MEKEKFTTIPQCLECYHYITYDEADDNFKCEAFPIEIPDNILRNKIKHNKIMAGQKGNYIFKEKILTRG
jgi:hypothetical protein